MAKTEKTAGANQFYGIVDKDKHTIAWYQQGTDNRMIQHHVSAAQLDDYSSIGFYCPASSKGQAKGEKDVLMLSTLVAPEDAKKGAMPFFAGSPWTGTRKDGSKYSRKTFVLASEWVKSTQKALGIGEGGQYASMTELYKDRENLSPEVAGLLPQIDGKPIEKRSDVRAFVSAQRAAHQAQKAANQVAAERKEVEQPAVAEPVEQADVEADGPDV